MRLLCVCPRAAACIELWRRVKLDVTRCLNEFESGRSGWAHGGFCGARESQKNFLLPASASKLVRPLTNSPFFHKTKLSSVHTIQNSASLALQASFAENKSCSRAIFLSSLAPRPQQLAPRTLISVTTRWVFRRLLDSPHAPSQAHRVTSRRGDCSARPHPAAPALSVPGLVQPHP